MKPGILIPGFFLRGVLDTFQQKALELFELTGEFFLPEWSVQAELTVVIKV